MRGLSAPAAPSVLCAGAFAVGRCRHRRGSRSLLLRFIGLFDDRRAAFELVLAHVGVHLRWAMRGSGQIPGISQPASSSTAATANALSRAGWGCLDRMYHHYRHRLALIENLFAIFSGERCQQSEAKPWRTWGSSCLPSARRAAGRYAWRAFCLRGGLALPFNGLIHPNRYIPL